MNTVLLTLNLKFFLHLTSSKAEGDNLAKWISQVFSYETIVKISVSFNLVFEEGKSVELGIKEPERV